MNLLETADVVEFLDVLSGNCRKTQAINRIQGCAMILQIHHGYGLEIRRSHTFVNPLQIRVFEILAPDLGELKDLPKLSAVVERDEIGSVPILRVPEIDRAAVRMSRNSRRTLDHPQTAAPPIGRSE